MTILDRLQACRPAGLSVMLLAFLLVAPVTLAHASLSDQTWLEGVYDQADFDDVVGLLTSSREATGNRSPQTRTSRARRRHRNQLDRRHPRATSDRIGS